MPSFPLLTRSLNDVVLDNPNNCCYNGLHCTQVVLAVALYIQTTPPENSHSNPNSKYNHKLHVAYRRAYDNCE